MPLEEVFMVLLHYVLHLVQIFLGEFIAVLKDGLDLVVNRVEGIKILLLKVPLLCLISQQWYFIGDFLIVLDGYLDPPILKIEQFH